MPRYEKQQYFADSDKLSAKSQVELVEIQSDYAGQRLDNFLFTRLKGVPKGHIYRLLRTGQVRVNKGRIKPMYKLCEGDIVRIPPVRQSESASGDIKPGAYDLEKLKQRILYEDNTLLILNKPIGMAVHGGSGLAYGVIEALRALRPDAPYLELVHRLDRDTSGCLMIAKRRSLLRELHDLLREHKVRKRYLALVQGEWQGGRRRVEVALEKNTLRSGERIVRVNKQGKPACSWFKPLAIQKKASLMQVEPLTGRTHQIRVHAQYSGHSIIGDAKYDGQVDIGVPYQRLFLHAAELVLPLANTIQVSAPLDQDYQAVLRALELVKK